MWIVQQTAIDGIYNWLEKTDWPMDGDFPDDPLDPVSPLSIDTDGNM